MLAEMSACAHRLGMAFGRDALRAQEHKRRAELFDLFERCFFGVRVAVALRIRLRRGAPEALRVEAREDRDRDDEPEARVRERSDADREVERASVPLLIKTLRGVASDAAALPGPLPADLTTLTALLARQTGTPGPSARPAAPGLRARLASSGVLPLATLPLRASSAGHAVAAQALRPRAATGPPRR